MRVRYIQVRLGLYASCFQRSHVVIPLLSGLNDSVFLAKLAETGGNPRQFFHRGYMSSLVAS